MSTVKSKTTAPEITAGAAVQYSTEKGPISAVVQDVDTAGGTATLSVPKLGITIQSVPFGQLTPVVVKASTSIRSARVYDHLWAAAQAVEGKSATDVVNEALAAHLGLTLTP